MITSFKRLIAALAVIVPAVALVTSPAMAVSQPKAKPHHASSHKTAAHKTTHTKKTPASTTS